MLKKPFQRHTVDEAQERERLMKLTEKELLVELILSMKRIDAKCEEIEVLIKYWN